MPDIFLVLSLNSLNVDNFFQKTILCILLKYCKIFASKQDKNAKQENADIQFTCKKSVYTSLKGTTEKYIKAKWKLFGAKKICISVKNKIKYNSKNMIWAL